ncbi:MAG: AMP-binding protein [Rhodospirillaceae bacterium]|nr:AMP-binding protein [Rhodospirillaceae bacterium]
MLAPYTKTTFGELPARVAARFGNREGLVFGDQRYTFAEMATRIDRTAKGLMAVGVQPGDKVGLWLLNQPEWLDLMFAIAKIGAVLVPINTRFRTRDLEYVLTQSDCAYLICHDVSGPIDYMQMVRAIVPLPAVGTKITDPDRQEMRAVITVSNERHAGTIAWLDLLADANNIKDDALIARAAAVDPDDPVFFMYTSGTTGFPKGAVHTHNLLRLIVFRAKHMAMSENDVILNYLPLFHLFGFSEGALMSMVSGAKQVLTATFDADECIQLAEREGATLMHGFETHLKEMVEAQQRHQGDLSSLRTGIFAAGMQSAVPILKRALEAFPTMRTVSGFGMSEVGVGVTFGALDDNLSRRLESSGGPIDGHEVRVIDPDTGRDQPIGVPGELLVKGYSIMQGYYKKPEETAKCYDTDGWFHTGDTASMREDGYIRFLGRYKDMLKVGGENVDPMETEGLLLDHPAVHQVAIVSLPDPQLTEVPIAFVEKVPGTDATAEDIIAYCRGKVASFKIPRHVQFVEDWPMTASGKIRKMNLRTTAKELFL